MRLRWSPSSPYTRKALVVASEVGVLDRIELVATAVTKPTPELFADNPLAKIPVLILDDGTSLFDSRVVCEYIDALGAGPKLFPAGGAARWRALRQQALGDGLLDAALLIRYELRRDEGMRSPAWVSAQMGRITRGLAAASGEDLAGALTIGHVTMAVALSYLDFRFADLDWRSTHPSLATWYDDSFAQRASMKASVLREKDAK